MRLRWTLATLLIIGVALCIAIGVDLHVYSDTIHPGVSVRGESLGGLSKAQAQALLEDRISNQLSAPFTLSGEGQQDFVFTPREAGILLDVEATWTECVELGARGPLAQRLGDIVRLWLGGIDIPPLLHADPVPWQSTMDDAALAFERLPHSASLVMISGEPEVIAARQGIALDWEELRLRVLKALPYEASAVEVPLNTVEPQVTTADARLALDTARRVFSSPLSLSYQGKRYRITAEELADIVEIDPSGIAVGRPLTFDTDAARELLARRLHNVQSPPVNAQIVPNESGHGYTVIPSEKGTIIEWDVLLSSMLTVAATSERREVPIATTTANPQLTTRDAELLSNRRKIVSFTTYFSPSNQARAGNIRQVAQILDNTVIRPGEIFSFNKTAGPRTKAAGFDAAPLIRGGMLTPGVGGGICQVSTTLFNSVFFAGLPVVERHPHSFFIEHYPMGRDAAVSYGTLDFRFRNDSEQILLMTAETTEHSVSISLAAPEWHRRVSYETGHFYDLVQPNSTAENPRRLRDPELAPGEVSEMEPGVAGRKMNVRRVVRDERGEVLLEDEFQSNYAPKDYVVRVGGQ